MKDLLEQLHGTPSVTIDPAAAICAVAALVIIAIALSVIAIVLALKLRKR